MFGIPNHFLLYFLALLVLLFMLYKYIKKPALIGSQGSVFFLLLVAFLLTFAIKEQNSMQMDEENHIHVIAYDPTDPNSLYIATHYVLEKLTSSGREPLGEYGDDFMGLVITSDGLFYSSGHSPDIENAGIRKSTDKGRSWTAVAFEGEDFHNMAVSYSNSSVIYGWSTPPTEFLAVSLDAGKTWTVVNTSFERSVFALAADHQNDSVLYAGTISGLYVSYDRGNSWHNTSLSSPVVALADDPFDSGRMYASTPEGVLQTDDGGKTWNVFSIGLPQNDIVVFLSVSPHVPQELYAVTKHGQVYKFSGDQWNVTSLGE